MLNTLFTVARELGGRLEGDGANRIAGFSIDTRALKQGELFFALKGERDGHEFLVQAYEKGASGAVVSAFRSDIPLPQIIVADTLQSLQLLAKKQLEKLAIPVVAVTGSNGKTTTKDMIAAILSTKYRTLKTEGNFNNEIGLPLTLLQLNPDHQAVVVEMAMRGRNQIRALTKIARPDIGVITNIAATHLELLGSMANIAAAKGELLTGLSADGTAVLNGDDSWCRALGKQFKGKVIYFGLDEGNEIRAVNIERRGWQMYFFVPALGGQEFQLPLPGLHNVRNALAALAVGSLLAVPGQLLVNGLKNLSLSSMRLEMVRGVKGTKIINDAYNANPSSTIASLKILKEVAAGRSLAVLGDMFELGDYAVNGHKEVGRQAVELGLDYLVTVGDLAGIIGEEALRQGMAKEKVSHFQDTEQALRAVKAILRQGDTVLVKGSRGMKMEVIVLGLMQAGD